MATRYFLPDGRDFESVFASGNSGINTGFFNAAGDDLGSLFMGGGSDEKAGIYNSSGQDIGKLFRLKGDYDQKILTMMDNAYGWTRYTINLQSNSWYYDPSSEYSGEREEVSDTFDNLNCLHIYERLIAGFQIEWTVRFKKDADEWATAGQVLPSGYDYKFDHMATKAEPWFTFALTCGGRRSKDAYNFYVEVLASAFVS